jgi:hypothetical protein
MIYQKIPAYLAAVVLTVSPMVNADSPFNSESLSGMNTPVQTVITPVDNKWFNSPFAKITGVDVAAFIRHAASRYKGQFTISDKKAVAEIDNILVKQFGARGRIAKEKNNYLRSIYSHSSTLMVNGYPMTAGILVSIARVHPSFPHSPGGNALASYFDAWIQEEDCGEEQCGFSAEQTRKAQVVLSGLRPEIQLAARLRMLGINYGDPIAMHAGKAALGALGVTASERVLIDNALTVN